VSAARDGAAPQGDAVELCAFRVGDEEYVIDLRRVREILNAGPVTAVPRAPEGIEGVMNVRGNLIPVVDVRERLAATPRPGSRAKVLVVEVAGRVLGLVVDGVIEVVRTRRSAIGPPPAAAAGARLFLGVCGARDGRPPSTRFTTRPGRKLRLLLNVKALLEPGAPAHAAETRRRASAGGA
jgi:purine-binding chemotaxis protein CheW